VRRDFGVSFDGPRTEILGKGIPLDPTPTTRDPFRELVAEIPDERVRDYLLTEL